MAGLFSKYVFAAGGSHHLLQALHGRTVGLADEIVLSPQRLWAQCWRANQFRLMLKFSTLDSEGKVKVHLDSYDCIIIVRTDEGPYLHGLASRLRALNPVSLTVILTYDPQDEERTMQFDRFRHSSAFNYLIALGEAMKIKLVFEEKAVKSKRRRTTDPMPDVHVVDYHTYGYKARIQKLKKHFMG